MAKLDVFIARTGASDEPAICLRAAHGVNPDILQYAKNIFADYRGDGQTHESEEKDVFLEQSVTMLGVHVEHGMYRVLTANGLTTVGISTNKKIRERVAALAWAIAAQVYMPKSCVPDPDKDGSFASLVSQAAEGFAMINGSKALAVKPQLAQVAKPQPQLAQVAKPQPAVGLKLPGPVVGIKQSMPAFRVNPGMPSQAALTGKPRVGFRGDSLLLLKNSGKKTKNHTIEDELQAMFCNYNVCVKCEAGVRVCAITKTILEGPQFECLFVAIGCNDLENPKGLVPEYPFHLDADLRRLCQAISARSKCSMILFGGPGCIWKYAPAWDQYINHAHAVLQGQGANVVPTNIAGEIMSQLTMHRDGVHFENSEEIRQYLGQEVGKMMRTCIEQCLNNGKSMEWPKPTWTPPQSTALAADGSKKRSSSQTEWGADDGEWWGDSGCEGMAAAAMSNMMMMGMMMSSMMAWGGSGGWNQGNGKAKKKKPT